MPAAILLNSVAINVARAIGPAIAGVRRNGAYFWELFHDSADTTRFVEWFMNESWLEHLRRHERASVADRAIRQDATQYMIANESTKSHHWIANRIS